MIERSVKRDEARKAATLGACRRSGWKDGAVRIGMTAEQVKFCGWGEPESVNRTVTQHGSAEQWVYGGGSYLYLENGRLVAIQD